jgi:hypothetical protein
MMVATKDTKGGDAGKKEMENFQGCALAVEMARRFP